MRLPLLTLLCFVLFLYLVETKWSDGAVLIENVFSLPDGVVAVSALNDFANELRQGETLTAAFTEFWWKLIS